MLEKIREGSQGLTAKIILGVVILTFALAGIGSYLGNTSTPPAATVNGEEISKVDFDQRYQSNRARMEQQFGQMFSQLAADESYMKKFKEGVLDQLIAEQLEDQLVEQLGLRVGDEKVKEIIRGMQEFQVDGKFDNDRYLALLRQANFQPSGFRDYVKVDSTRRQLRQAVQTTDFSLPTEVNQYNQLDKQTRDIEYLVFKQADFKDQITLSDEDKQLYYDAHQESFRSQELVAIEYVELKVSDIMKSIAVSDEQLETYYQENITNYRNNVARRRASQIQIDIGDDESVAKAKADAALARLKAGEDFAVVAKEISDDSFSAEKGGDVDWFEKGVMGDEFDNAVFALKNVGDITDVVRIDSSFHIFKLTADEPESTKSFAEVKDMVATAYKQNKANDIFSDKQTQLAELGFEVPDTLHDAANAVGETVKETALFGRIGAPAAVNFPKVIEAAFSDLVLLQKVNSELIEVSDDHVMIIRLKQHEPSRTRSMDEVIAQIESALMTQKSEEMAKAKAESLLAKLDGSQKLSEDEDSKSLAVVSKAGVERFTADVDSALRSELFKMPHPDADKQSLKVVKMSTGDYAVVALSQVNVGKVPEDTKAIEQRMSSQRSQQSYQSFVAALKETAKIVKSGKVTP